MPRRCNLRSWLILVAVTLCTWPLAGSGATASYVPGRLIVRYKPKSTASARASVLADIGGQRLGELKLINGAVLSVQSGLGVERALQIARQNPSVLYAEPDYILHAARVPNDPRFSELWAMRNRGQTGGTPAADIRATNAWDVFRGSAGVKVGVIDTGIDYTHPDLAANIWTNPGEIPANGIDDDGNGYVDDVHGYDFVNNDGDPMDDHYHGTHCAGTIGGVGNNGAGVTGINWTVSLVGIKFLDAGGSGSTSAAIAAVQYAIAIGCNLTSNSWGGGAFSQALLDAINAAGAANQLFIAAAGNNGSNNDALDFYPANYASPAVIAVAATDQNDQLASFSNCGATTVDLAAPGVDILSCQPGGQYQLLSGTSMATPHVAGVAALIYGRFPGITNSAVRSRLLSFVDPIPALAGRCVTGGRLDAMLAIADPDSIAPAPIADLTAVVPGSTTMSMSWTAVGDDGSTGTASRTELRYATLPIDDASWPSATMFPTGNPAPPGSSQHVEVTDLAYDTLYYFAIKAFDEWNNASPLSLVTSGTTLGAPAASATSLALVDLRTGEQTSRTLTIANAGQGTLDFSIPAPQLLFKTARGKAATRVRPPLALAKGQFDPRVGDLVESSSGGPDAFGYRWRDSDDPGGPAFAWVELAGVGTAVHFTGDDQNLGPYPLGFSFPFYGGSFSEFHLCSNGWLSFTSTLTNYSNQQLPTGGTANPENVVAPLWDDLNFPAGGSAYYFNDGSRLIVEWKDVPHFSTGGPYSFEAILYPNGKIVFQYLTVHAPDNSATVGSQNGDRTGGLNVAFNTPYVHDHLAVQILPLGQWLTVTPAMGRVGAGQRTDVTVHYDATGMTDGLYEANVLLLTNAPDGATNVPAQLHVSGAPDVAAQPAATAFGLVYTGRSAARDVVIQNQGTAPLHVSSIGADDPVLTASPGTCTVGIGASQVVTLTYAPTAPAALAATVTIASDDPDEPTTTLAVTGSSNDAPVADASHTILAARLVQNGSESQVLRLRNTAVETATALHYDIAPSVQKASTAVHVASLALAKDERDPRPGMPATNGLGGPDAGGYRWRDSDAPGGPDFTWIDITGIGTAVNFSLGSRDDGNSPNIPLGFTFPYYGASYTKMNVCTNGWVSFTSVLTSYDNQPLPTSSTYPENLVAGLWDDLDLRTAGQVYTWGDGSKFVIEWAAVPHYSTGGPYTFEIVVYRDGRIVLQYLTMPAPTNSATIGIQNSGGTAGLQVVYNAAYLHDNLAIALQRTPEWLGITPESGDVAGREFIDLSVNYHAAGLELGTYHGLLHLTTNDPEAAVIDIPVTLQVVAPTDGAGQSVPSAFALSMLSANPARHAARFMLAIPQRETVDVCVYNVRGEAIRQLSRAAAEPGYQVLGWDGRTDDGAPVASGVYFVRMRAGGFARTLRVAFMR